MPSGRKKTRPTKVLGTRAMSVFLRREVQTQDERLPKKETGDTHYGQGLFAVISKRIIYSLAYEWDAAN